MSVQEINSRRATQSEALTALRPATEDRAEIDLIKCYKAARLVLKLETKGGSGRRRRRMKSSFAVALGFRLLPSDPWLPPLVTELKPMAPQAQQFTITLQ
ncbi:hypothetical protein EVAR_45291_1 [Eumeta japonica]|uniref:Uncharacterized protein n=1 Tax=Eumeta variegata TaxID=151549 RepID=A0A4C1Y7R8_EUMVA|nr:hypothetical protein EVAR_45291_1 [Eumeta japonica]